MDDNISKITIRQVGNNLCEVEMHWLSGGLYLVEGNIDQVVDMIRKITKDAIDEAIHAAL